MAETRTGTACSYRNRRCSCGVTPASSAHLPASDGSGAAHRAVVSGGAWRTGGRNVMIGVGGRAGRRKSVIPSGENLYGENEARKK